MSDLGNKEIFSKNLKRFMESHKIKRTQLAEIIDVPYSTFNDWYNGVTYPRIDKIERMAQYFGILKSDLIEEKTVQQIPTPTANKPTIQVTNQMKKTVQIMSRLNEDGQDEVLHHAELIESSGRYTQAPIVREVATYTELYSVGGAAAGSGYAYNDFYKDVESNYRVILSDEVPKHDLVLDVKGNSMFPTIYDGDVIFIRKTYDKIDGKIYAIDIDGEVVVKRVIFGTDSITLVSDNPDWGDRIVRGFELEERTHFIGQVVGWETPMK